MKPETGERVWYYQATPSDPFDYDTVQTPINATIQIDGKPTKVVMQANRNGFLYVVDAKTGKLLAGVDLGLVARVIRPGARHEAQKRSRKEPFTAFHW